VAIRDGHGRRRAITSRSEPDVEASLADLRHRATATELAASNRGTVAEPVDISRVTVGHQLLAWLAAKRGSVGPSSYVRYEEIVRLHLAGVAQVPLAQLAPEHVRQHMRKLSDHGVAPATARSALRVLQAAIAMAEGDGLVPRNVARLVASPKVQRPATRALSLNEVHALVRAAEEDLLRPLWLLLIGTGLRMGEALGLRWEDVDFDKGTISVNGSLRHQPRPVRGSGPRLARVAPKSEAGFRTVFLPLFVIAALREQRLHDAGPRNVAGFIFTRPSGAPCNPSTVQRRFAALVERAGLPYTNLHVLRHTYATTLLASGATLDDLKRAMGHSSISVTSDVYGHFVEGRGRELAGLMERAFS
jgi:integrase